MKMAFIKMTESRRPKNPANVAMEATERALAIFLQDMLQLKCVSRALCFHLEDGEAAFIVGFTTLTKYSILFLTLGGLFFLPFGSIFGVWFLTLPAFVSEPWLGMSDPFLCSAN